MTFCVLFSVVILQRPRTRCWTCSRTW